MEPKHCPTCGKNNIIEYTYDDGDDIPFYGMACEDCETQGPSMRTPEDALIHWNLGQMRGYKRCMGWIITDKNDWGKWTHNHNFALGDGVFGSKVTFTSGGVEVDLYEVQGWGDDI